MSAQIPTEQWDAATGQWTPVRLHAVVSHLVMFSGGVGSWAAAKRVAAKHGTNAMTLLFADTLIEDEDLYRFITEAANNVGAPLLRIADGRTPWDIAHERGMMSNARVPLCSIFLKRDLLNKWRDEHCSPDCVIYYGIDWTERHRLDAVRALYPQWQQEAPMCEPPYVSKEEMLKQLEGEGITAPRLYKMGFPHNNCGGFCVKAGQAHFANLLRKMPERYEQHAAEERKFRAHTGKDVSILKDRRGGTVKPLTLDELKRRILRQEELDLNEWGGCGCALDG